MQYQNATAAPREELTDIIMDGVTDFGEFQGLALLPAVPLRLPTGHVPKITIAKGDLLRASTRNRAPGTNFTRWQSAIEDHSITLLQVSEEVQLPDEQTLLYEDYFAFEQLYAGEASNRLRRSHEIESAGAIFNTGNFDSTNSAVAWTAANKATMTPVEDLLAAIRLVKGRGERANTFQMSGAVFDRLRVSTEMVSFVAGSVNPGAKVTTDTIQLAFAAHGIEQVLIGDGYVNQSEALTSNSINAIWSNTYVFVGACKPGQLRTGGVGRTFYWEKQGPLFNVSSYRDEPKASNVIRAMKTTLTDITNARAGTLIATQFS